MYKIYKDTAAWSNYEFVIMDCYSDQYFFASLTKFNQPILDCGGSIHKCLESDKQYIYLGECKYRKDILLTLPMLDLLADI